MSYIRTDPAPSGLNPGETAVTLDDGTIVAVQAVTSVQETSGCPVITATARAIKADGSPETLPDGSPIASTFPHTSCPDEITAAGGIDAVQKCVLLAVLGEPTAPLWQDPIHATALANASIRTMIASAAHAGQVDAGALL
jgi:hypothetical protein